MSAAIFFYALALVLLALLAYWMWSGVGRRRPELGRGFGAVAAVLAAGFCGLYLDRGKAESPASGPQYFTPQIDAISAEKLQSDLDRLDEHLRRVEAALAEDRTVKTQPVQIEYEKICDPQTGTCRLVPKRSILINPRRANAAPLADCICGPDCACDPCTCPPASLPSQSVVFVGGSDYVAGAASSGRPAGGPLVQSGRVVARGGRAVVRGVAAVGRFIGRRFRCRRC